MSTPCILSCASNTVTHTGQGVKMLRYFFSLQEEVLTVFDRIALSPEEICAGFFGSKCGTSYDPFHQHWNITVDKNKPPVEPVYPPKVGNNAPLFHVPMSPPPGTNWIAVYVLHHNSKI